MKLPVSKRPSSSYHAPMAAKFPHSATLEFEAIYSLKPSRR